MKRETVVTREIMHVKRTLFFFFFTNEDQRTTINLVAETSWPPFHWSLSVYSITYLRYFFKNSIDTKTQIINVNFANIIVAASGRKIDTREGLKKKKEKKRTLPSQHLILNIDDNLAAPREMRVWRRRLFEFGETSWSALLIQYLLLLKAFYLEPRFVPLIVNPRKYQHVQNQ